MNGIDDGALTQRRGELSRAQLRADGMQRVARGDLGMAPPIGATTHGVHIGPGQSPALTSHLPGN